MTDTSNSTRSLLLKLPGFLFFSMAMYFTVLMALITFPYLSLRHDVDFLLTKQTVLHVDAWLYSFYVHITSSLFVLLSGTLQLVKGIRFHYPAIHRSLGKLYVFLVLFLSAPSGLIMGYYANGGFWSQLSFILIALFWWSTTFMAYLRIRKGDVESHRYWMYRSYALTLSAITLRIYVFVLPMVSDLHGREMYTLVAWLSWIPNLLLAEVLIRWNLRQLRTGASVQ